MIVLRELYCAKIINYSHMELSGTGFSGPYYYCTVALLYRRFEIIFFFFFVFFPHPPTSPPGRGTIPSKEPGLLQNRGVELSCATPVHASPQPGLCGPLWATVRLS